MGIERRMRIVEGGEQDEHIDVSVQVAFATSDMKHVDQHFGSAQSFAIYAVNPDRIGLVEASQFGKLAQDGNEDKLAVKIDNLKECAAVFCQAVGASAIRQLLAHGIQPVKVSPGAEIKDLLDSLQEQLREGPSAWLAKAIQRQGDEDMGRFDAMASEGWDE
jgi:nitrogen fixation protein NifX